MWGQNGSKRGAKFGPFLKGPNWPHFIGAVLGSKFWPHFWGQNGPFLFTVWILMFTEKYNLFCLLTIKAVIKWINLCLFTSTWTFSRRTTKLKKRVNEPNERSDLLCKEFFRKILHLVPRAFCEGCAK